MLKIAVLGDVAIANLIDLENFENRLVQSNIEDCDLVIMNLEGAIVDSDYYDSSSLWNVKDIVRVLKKYNIHVTLANNHISDIPGQLNNTVSLLEQNFISYSGVIQDDGLWHGLIPVKGRYIGVFPACWHVLLSNNNGNLPVIDIYSAEINRAVKEFKKCHPNGVAIVMPHWSIDFENIPFPRDRKLARIWMDEGADIVAGSHSHTVQCSEFYCNKPISYSLGNFLISNGIFRDGRVTYSSRCQSSLINKYEVDLTNKISLEQKILSEIPVLQEDLSIANHCYAFTYLTTREKKLLPLMVGLHPILRIFSDKLIKTKIKILKILISKKLYNWKRG